MPDAGCPEPAAVVDSIEKILNRFAFCLMASIVAADGAVAAVIRPLPQVPAPDFTRFRLPRRALVIFSVRIARHVPTSSRPAANQPAKPASQPAGSAETFPVKGS